MPKSPSTARVRRPAKIRQVDRRYSSYTEAEGRRLNAWMRHNGFSIDNEAIRKIVLERLDAEGIIDPGPDSEEGQPLTSPWRQTVETGQPAVPKQLQLTA